MTHSFVSVTVNKMELWLSNNYFHNTIHQSHLGNLAVCHVVMFHRKMWGTLHYCLSGRQTIVNNTSDLEGFTVHSWEVLNAVQKNIPT